MFLLPCNSFHKSMLFLIVSILCMPLFLSSASANECHPLSLTACSLPFPSDTFTPSSMDSLIAEEILSQLPESFKPSNIMGSRDGFSPAAPVLFEAPFVINAGAIPIDGGNILYVFDLDDPQNVRIPVRVRISQVADIQNSEILENDPEATTSQVIEAWPRSRFPFGHRLAAVLTTALQSSGDDEATSTDLPQSYDDLIDELEENGINQNDILSLTEFTISTESNITGVLFDMVSEVENQPHPVRNLDIKYQPIGPIAVQVTGEIRLTSFRSEDGTVVYSAGDTGEDYWTPFDLYLPHQAKNGGVPIQIYGHGLSADRSSVIVVSISNAANGMATITIDQPNHGDRKDKDGGYILDIFEPGNIGLVTGMVAQSTIDLNSLMAAIRGSLSNLDLLPRKHNFWNWLFHNGGYKKPDIDTSRIFYAGTSLGGVLGNAFVGTATELDGAFLQVTGAGITNVLAHSSLYESLGFDQLIPEGSSGPEAAVMFAIVQHVLDKGDGLNLIHNVRNPDIGGQVTPLVVQYGMGDAIVFNDATIALAELTDLPMVCPIREPVEQLRIASAFEDGFGLVQSPSLLPIGGDIQDLAAHMSFLTPNAMIAYQKWLDAVVKN